MLNFSKQNLYAGDNWSWSETIDDKSAQDYSLKIIIKQKTNAAIEIPSTADGRSFKFNYDASSLPSGLYNYQAKLTKKSDNSTSTYEAGSFSVNVNLSTAGDPRDYWAIIAENLKDIYKKLSTREVSEATYNGRTFRYKDTRALLQEIENAEIRAGISEPIPVIRERY